MDSERTKLQKGDNFEHTYEGPLSLDGRWEKCEVRMQKVEERGDYLGNKRLRALRLWSQNMNRFKTGFILDPTSVARRP